MAEGPWEVFWGSVEWVATADNSGRFCTGGLFVEPDSSSLCGLLATSIASGLFLASVRRLTFLVLGFGWVTFVVFSFAWR